MVGNVTNACFASCEKDAVLWLKPLCGPLARGGPFMLARVFTDLNEFDLFADACHLCYSVRLELLDHFPGYLKPRQVYGQVKNEDITD